MEHAQRELASVLLDHIRSLGLISNAVYLGAMDRVYSAADFPEFFRYPVCPAKEAGVHECTSGAP